jgi:hypothetical protein
MFYILTLVGGPKDGEEVHSPRPFALLHESDGSFYAADDDGPVWLSDDTRGITLRFRGYRSAREYLAEVERM